MANESTHRTIILLMVDQLAARWLEVAKDGIVDLPNFEALQKEGVTFQNAFSTNPVCSPSRASLATGLSNSSHGVVECGYDLDPAVPTFMQALQRDGWRTGAFGKLHFITQIETLRPDYRPYGFDVVCNTEDSRAGEWLDWVKESHPEHYEAAQSTVWMTMVPELEQYGPDRENLRAQILAAREKFPQSATDAYELPFPAEVSQTAWITDRARDFILDESGDVFAQISYVQPHNPFAPPAEYVDRVNVAAIPDPVHAEWESEPIPYYQQERYREPSYASRDWRRDRQLYFADLAHLDHELGRIREALTASGRLNNTLFVFTSDHGELLHDHGLLGKWERHYDPCIRVPLIVSATGMPSAELNHLTEHTDIAATIYDWSGAAPPMLPMFNHDGDDFKLPMLHGRSLLPTIRGDESAVTREIVYVQSNNSHMDPSPASWARTIRTKRYRYTRHLDGGGEQLFDLEKDPSEQVNLAYNGTADAILEELRFMLTEALVGDGYPSSQRQLFKIGAW